MLREKHVGKLVIDADLIEGDEVKLCQLSSESQRG
jgi:hypothetical protein